MGDAWVLGVRRAEHALRLRPTVRLPYFLDVQRGEHHAFGVAQGERGAGAQLLGEALRHIQRDRDGP